MTPAELKDLLSQYLGQTIAGSYRLDEGIGEPGSFGWVFRATETVLGEPAGTPQIAVKLIPPQGDVARQKQELFRLKGLKHPNIIHASHIGSHDHLMVLVMELADGNLRQDLDAMETEPALSPRRLALAEQVCRAVADALIHLKAPERDLVHQDIKPENILRFGDTWKLGDFGLVNKVGGAGVRETYTLSGTLAFRPPEGAKLGEKGTVSSGWDVWSLGVTLTEVLTGQLPFRVDESLLDPEMTEEERDHVWVALINKAIRMNEPDFGDVALPSPFDRIVAGCLTKAMDHRWTAESVRGAFNSRRLSGTVSAAATSYTPGQIISATLRDGSAAPELCAIPPGVFDMGDLSGRGSSNERPVVPNVRFESWFGLGRYGVTFEDYDRYVAAKKVAKLEDVGWGRGRLPVINVSWNDAQGYIGWLNEQSGFGPTDRHRWRLPTEAEWEYACRAGSRTEFWWGDEISTSQANYNGNYTFGKGTKGEYRERTVAVDSFQPNPWGLFQMHGNVWEWCEDAFDEKAYGTHPGVYPKAIGPEHLGKGKESCARVVRGGSWNGNPGYLRSAFRYWITPVGLGSLLGFRLARTLP